MSEPEPKPSKTKHPEKTKPGTTNATETRPSILEEDRLKLWVRSGGRCAFCNKYLLEDEFFIYEIPFGEMAHIVGWKDSTRSPRGNSSLPVAERNRADNLMLLCTEHHLLIDKGPLLPDFPVDRLLEQKHLHEERIFHLTSLNVDRESAVIRMFGKIRGATVGLSREEVREAVFESEARYARFPFAYGNEGVEIDLSQLPEPEENWEAYWSIGQSAVDRQLDRIADGIKQGKVRHLSVFALARMPLLVYLGYQLDDKIPTVIYQKHRLGDESWAWPDDQETVLFETQQIQVSPYTDRVALILSISGKIPIEHLPAAVDGSFNVFEIRPAGVGPSRDIVRNRATLDAFSKTYHDFLSGLEVTHKAARELDVFPSLPLSAAVACGRGIMRNVQPALKIYDRGPEAFRLAVTVNSR